MLKMTRLFDKLASSRNNGSKLTLSRNNNSRPISKKNNGNGKVNRFNVGENSVEHAKMSGKLSKSRKSKNKKISKSWNLAKSGKKLSKSENSTKFNITKAKSKFLTLDARTAFNYLRLAFTEALILWHFDPECHIWIEINALGYAINRVLSQLTSKTNPNGIVTKINLG